MNSINKKTSAVRGIPQPFSRHAAQFKSLVTQLKTGVTTQSIQRRVRPPVSRPQAPKMLLPKMANGGVNRKPPVSPPVNRPQQLPKVLQAKSAVAQSPQSGQATHRPVASQVNRFEGMKTSQPKTMARTSPLRSTPAIHRHQAQSIQCKPVEVRVTGLTHLVARHPMSGSIHGGTEGPEVTAHDRIVVETSERVRSRRGLNSETFANYDRVSGRIYRWYLVTTLNGQRFEGSRYYIREDAFEFASEADRPRVSRDLSVLDHRRTRQSHKLIRLEAWYNKDRSVDQTEHMILYDYERQTYREYAIGPSPAVQMHAPWDLEAQARYFIDDEPPPSASYKDVRDGLEKESAPKGLRAYETPVDLQIKHMRDQSTCLVLRMDHLRLTERL